MDDQKFMDCGCDGRVEYRFDERTLELRDAVSLAYRDGSQLTTFECEALECVLVDPAVQEGTDGLDKTLADQFEKITATGRPAVLKSESIGADFSAVPLLILRWRWANLDGGRRIAGRQCQLRNWQYLPGTQMRAVRTEPRLLQLTVDGFGRAFFRDDGGTTGTLSWEDSFKIRELAGQDSAGRGGLQTANDPSARQTAQTPSRKFDFVIGGDVKGRFALSSAAGDDRKTSGQFGTRKLAGAV